MNAIDHPEMPCEFASQSSQRGPAAQRWRLAAAAAAVLLASSASASPCNGNANLIENGDAETGSMAGWLSTGAEVVSSGVAGTVGVPPDQAIGKWSFTGGLGATTESMSQTIDLSPWAAEIDSGELSASFCILVQSRAIPGAVDQVSGLLLYRDGAGATLDSLAFQDPQIVVNAPDWDLVSDARILPPGTRDALLTLTFTRAVGVSTDAFADNATLSVVQPCPADLNGDDLVDGADLGLLLGSWGATGGSAADLDGSGTVDGADLGLLLGAWGAC